MGYTTWFGGTIEIRPQLPQEFVDRWNKAKKGDPKHPYTSSWGPNGKFDAGKDFDMLFGFPRHIGIAAQPASWCGWELQNFTDTPAPGDPPSYEPYTELRHDGGEKFYDYAEWLQYFISAVLHEFPGSNLNGEITWNGEEQSDIGKLYIDGGNLVHAVPGTIVYQERI